MNDFQFNIHPFEAHSIVQLGGKLIDEEMAREMLEALEKAMESGQPNFIINLKKLDYINSSGLNTLVHMLTKARNKGGDVILSQLSDKVKDLFIVTKLNTVFTVTESNEEAIEGLTAKS